MYREDKRKATEVRRFLCALWWLSERRKQMAILSKKVPWQEIEKDYKEKPGNTEMGAPAKSLRMALGSLIIKEKLQISNREVVDQIRENPYLQCFVRVDGYKDEARNIYRRSVLPF